jgi:RHS repeat-associated protein
VLDCIEYQLLISKFYGSVCNAANKVRISNQVLIFFSIPTNLEIRDPNDKNVIWSSIISSDGVASGSFTPTTTADYLVTLSANNTTENEIDFTVDDFYAYVAPPSPTDFVSLFLPDVLAYNDYYPFGMLVPNRHGTSDSYRYGFNGKEKDDEVKGEGTQYDYGFRVYDPRIGKFLSEDPLFRSYAWYTPYQFAGNRPINSTDLDGLEEYSSYESYKLHSGDAALSGNMLNGSDGVWFTQDRIDRTDRWKSAMEHITKTQDISKLTAGTINSSGSNTYSFKQVRDYYLWAQYGMDKNGFASRWAKGAAYLVDELADTFEANDEGSSVMSGNMGTDSGILSTDFGNLMKSLNIGIAEFAIGRFNSVLYGGEGEIVVDWYEWDKEFIWNEQVTVAAPGVYHKFAGTTALSQMNSLARNEGIFRLAVPKHNFPNFALFDIDISDPSTNFGAAGRFNVPLDMLYPEKNKNESGKLNKDQQKSVEAANAEIDAYYEENKCKD